MILDESKFMSTQNKNSSPKSFVIQTNDSFQGIANCESVEKRSLGGASSMSPQSTQPLQPTSTAVTGASAMKPQSSGSK